MKHYQKHYFDRLLLLDMHFETKYINDSVKALLLLIPQRMKILPTEKKTLWKTTFVYNAFYIRDFPLDVLKYIFEFLHEFDFVRSIVLRNKYEDVRKDINSFMRDQRRTGGERVQFQFNS
jgi:hypothetical protein